MRSLLLYSSSLPYYSSLYSPVIAERSSWAFRTRAEFATEEYLSRAQCRAPNSRSRSTARNRRTIPSSNRHAAVSTRFRRNRPDSEDNRNRKTESKVKIGLIILNIFSKSRVLVLSSSSISVAAGRHRGPDLHIRAETGSKICAKPLRFFGSGRYCDRRECAKVQSDWHDLFLLLIETVHQKMWMQSPPFQNPGYATGRFT